MQCPWFAKNQLTKALFSWLTRTISWFIETWTSLLNSWKPFSKELYSNLKFLFICSPSVCKPAEEDQYSINQVCVWRQQQAHFIITTIWIEHTHWILRLFLVVNLPCYLSLNTTLAQRALTSSFNMVSSMLCKTTGCEERQFTGFHSQQTHNITFPWQRN